MAISDLNKEEQAELERLLKLAGVVPEADGGGQLFPESPLGNVSGRLADLNRLFGGARDETFPFIIPRTSAGVLPGAVPGQTMRPSGPNMVFLGGSPTEVDPGPERLRAGLALLVNTLGSVERLRNRNKQQQTQGS